MGGSATPLIPLLPEEKRKLGELVRQPHKVDNLPDLPPEPSEKRFDLGTRREIQDFIDVSGYSREDAVLAVATTRIAGDAVPTEDQEKLIEDIVAGKAPMPAKPEIPPIQRTAGEVTHS